jgi:hypothetical protein
MKRIHAAIAVTLLVIAVAALLGRAERAVSQTAGGHDHHAATKSPATSGEKSKAMAPKPAADGKTYTLPGVPAGKLSTGGGLTTTITGEVMDPACFLEAGEKSVGTGHFQCAVDCAKSGQTLAIYDREQDRIYFVAGELPGRNPNDPLINFIHQKVDVLGTVYHRSQAWGIVIVKVSPHQAKTAPASASK